MNEIHNMSDFVSMNIQKVIQHDKEIEKQKMEIAKQKAIQKRWYVGIYNEKVQQLVAKYEPIIIETFQHACDDYAHSFNVMIPFSDTTLGFSRQEMGVKDNSDMHIALIRDMIVILGEKDRQLCGLNLSCYHDDDIGFRFTYCWAKW